MRCCPVSARVRTKAVGRSTRERKALITSEAEPRAPRAADSLKPGGGLPLGIIGHFGTLSLSLYPRCIQEMQRDVVSSQRDAGVCIYIYMQMGVRGEKFFENSDFFFNFGELLRALVFELIFLSIIQNFLFNDQAHIIIKVVKN